MKRILLGLVVVLMAGSPAWCEERELDVAQEMEHLQVQREQAEFRFDQEMRELELGERRMELAQRNAKRPAHKAGEIAHVIWLVCMVTHLLMALWVYQDVRKKDNGNGIWIVITLLVGFFGAAVYALIRIGDCSPKTE
jgi:hypothetical protein